MTPLGRSISVGQVSRFYEVKSQKGVAMSNYKLAFFDIDGTLADNEMPHNLGILARIPASARAALLALKQNGIEPVIATGRSKAMIEEVVRQLGLDSIVSSNGQVVTYKGRDIYEKGLSQGTAAKILSYLEESNRDFLFETKSAIYRFEGAHQIADPTMPITFLKKGAPLPENILQFTCPVKPDEQFKLDLEGIVAVKVGPSMVNIHLQETSKATGIHQMLQKIGVTSDETICFGDEENDSEMFEAVGTSVAMGNAADFLKAKADYVTETVGNDGIWRACQHFGLY
jgi:Cof subfamily protein (haloacid dehalogenase superfamily)